MNERDREFADAARAIDESLIMRAVTNIVRRATLSGSRIRPVGGAKSPLTAALKGPLYVLGVGVACLTHALLLQFIPDRLAPVKPLAYGMVLAFAALATAAGLMTMRSSATAIADSSAGTANTRNS